MGFKFEQIQRLVNPAEKKEMWEHFKPIDLKVLAAYMKGYQLIGHMTKRVEEVNGKPKAVVAFEPAPYFVNAMSQAKRPWTIYERFMLAIRAFHEKKKTFDIARFDIANNRVLSDTILHPDDIKESKVIYDKIMDWDEEFLDQMVKDNGFILEKLGFKPLKKGEFAPFEEVKQASDIEMAIRDQATNKRGRVLNSENGLPAVTMKDKVLEILADGPAKRSEIVSALKAKDEKVIPQSVFSVISTMVTDKILVADAEAGTVAIA